MDIRNKLYPYPVLNEQTTDYIDSVFKFEVDVARDIRDIVINLKVRMTNSQLQDLIDTNKAEYLYHIECSQTSYRTIIKTADIDTIKRIPETKLNGRVSICSFLVAKESISNYTNSKFNEDYDNTTFNISKGSILGIGGQTNIDITKEMEEVSKIPSIFSILKRNVDNNEGMEIEISGDKIKIFLCSEDFNNYKRVSFIPSFLPILHSMLIMPTLLYTIQVLRESGIEEYESYRWFKSMDNTLRKYDLKLDNEYLENIPSYKLAQKLLELPINKALISMCSIGSEDEE